MKLIIIIAKVLCAVMSIFSVILYWSYYLNNYHTLSETGAGGLAWLGILLTAGGIFTALEIFYRE